MSALIVYYSMGGNVDWAAREIAARTGAELLRIAPGKAYPDKGLRKFLWGGKSAVMGDAPTLVPYSFDAARYDTVILGFPVWAGTFAPPMRTFLREQRHALAGKRIAAFACQSGSGAEKAFARLREAAGAQAFAAELVLVDPLTRPDAQNSERISRFCDTLLAQK